MSLNFAHAVDLGGLDLTFSADGSTDGFDVSGVLGYNRYGADVEVDSQGRIYVVGTYDTDFNGQMVKEARVERRLKNGNLDTTFDTDGVVKLALPPSGWNQFEYELAVDSSDGVFVGYSREYCQTDNNCEAEVYVYHYNANGFKVGGQQIEFDLGSTDDRIDDNFSDMVYVPSINKLAIAATVERTNVNDTDFGIAVLDVNPTSGALSIDNTFSTDGKSQCWFDHAGGGGSEDNASAIVYNPYNQTYIVGGSAFEGNGSNADGWNMAFCEFDMSGALVKSWSTQSGNIVFDNREFVADMIYTYDGPFGIGPRLLVAGSASGSGGTDFTITRYMEDQLGQWVPDTAFGENANGSSVVGFNYIFVGDTNDFAAEMVVEEDGGFVIAGSAGWEDNNQQGHSAVTMARFTQHGLLDSNWGIGHSGKAVHTFNATSFWDYAHGLAYDPVSEELYITGWSYNGDFQSLVANFHNDMIFGGNFDF